MTRFHAKIGLALARPGLSPGKMRQAYLGAITFGVTRAGYERYREAPPRFPRRPVDGMAERLVTPRVSVREAVYDLAPHATSRTASVD